MLISTSVGRELVGMRALSGRILLIALAAAVSVSLAVPSVATSDPVQEIIEPTRDPALLYPTPLPDAWFVPPPGFENTAPGTVLHTRPTTVGPLLTPVFATQLLVRSTDSKDRPIPVVTTVIVPQAPWTGPGARPLVAYNTAIDSLGLTCVPSWTLPRGSEIELAAIQLLLAKNYAVIVTDHQGPRQAYAAGRISGHAVLDSLRATVNTPWLGLSPDSPIAVSGYSGGAIASGWTAELAPTYAPELRIVGVAIGGAPVDYRLLLGSMNGRNLASSVFLAATMGVAREYPELFELMNTNGWRLGMIARDWCLAALAPVGVVAPIPVEALSDVPNVVATPIAQRVLDATRLGGQAPTAPVYIYQGQQEIWIPREGAERLYDEWCAKGARVRLDEFVGEHLVVALSGIPAANSWIDDRLTGKPMAEGCSAFGR
ncbi:lipase family protein [Antrihabitans stalagmiti]|nr:lipase family protein [Antrihabitans stalagmiti]